MGPGASEALVKRKLFMGNWPSNTLFFPLFTPATLGSFIALYEHKILTQGLIRASTYLVRASLVWVHKSAFAELAQQIQWASNLARYSQRIF